MVQMRSYRALFAVLAMFVVAISPVLAEDGDAATISNPETQFTFDNMSGGTITFYVDNTDSNKSFTMTVTVYKGDSVVATKENVRVPGAERVTVDVSMPDFKEVGTHNLRVVCEPAGEFDINSFGVTVTVTKNILSNWVTYAVIIIAVIAIAIFAYLKMRDGPKQKPQMTFEQLEEERKAEMAARADKRKVKDEAPTTERQRYLADKKKKQ